MIAISKELEKILERFNLEELDKENGYLRIRPSISGDMDTTTEFEFEDEYDLIEQIDDRFEYYDVDEEVKMWVESGVSGKPSVREIVRDCEDYEKELKKLAVSTEKYIRRKNGKEIKRNEKWIKQFEEDVKNGKVKQITNGKEIKEEIEKVLKKKIDKEKGVER